MLYTLHLNITHTYTFDVYFNFRKNFFTLYIHVLYPVCHVCGTCVQVCACGVYTVYIMLHVWPHVMYYVLMSMYVMCYIHVHVCVCTHVCSTSSTSNVLCMYVLYECMYYTTLLLHVLHCRLHTVH